MLTAAAFALSIQAVPFHKPFLSPIFGDHMVLQRGKLNTFWGWTTSHERVTVTLNGMKASTESKSDGEWQVKFKPPKGPGPYDLMIDGPEHAELHDVLIGDVWLCGGQSNMEFGMTMASNADQAIKDANHPDIRLFTVGHNYAFDPVVGAIGSWSVCTPKSVAEGGWGGFSAVGYFFGLRLEQEEKVPIGLIEDCWGGTPAEAWTGEQALRPTTSFDDDFKLIDHAKDDGCSAADSHLDLWLADSDPGIKAKPAWTWPSYDDASWQTVNLPGGFKDLKGGSKPSLVWFRKEIDLPYDLPAEGATLDLGPVNSIDDTYVNGIRVGGEPWGPWQREYAIPATILQGGPNLIAIRVVAQNGGGYVGTKPSDLVLRAGGKEYALDGPWKAKLGIDLTQPNSGPKTYFGFPDLPSVLYNGMIAPVAPLALKGAIWYQGESNADRAYQYRQLLPAMIGSWRQTFQQEDMPFYIVSLAAYMARKPDPSDDSWAELREAQAMTASKVKDCGLALAIDVGNADDIHPKDKQTVGDRLALVALAKTYGEKIPYSGPVYEHMSVHGSKVRLEFAHATGGLVLKGDTSGSFALAGSDHKWYWADAQVVGNGVVLSSTAVPHPVAARYAWQANPPAPLYNGAGLPAVPFRTDDWPGLTYGKQ